MPEERKQANQLPSAPELGLWESPTLLAKLEKTLTRAKEKLTHPDRKTLLDVEKQADEEDQYIVRLVEDAIQKAKAGVAQPAQPK